LPVLAGYQTGYHRAAEPPRPSRPAGHARSRGPAAVRVTHQAVAPGRSSTACTARPGSWRWPAAMPGLLPHRDAGSQAPLRRNRPRQAAETPPRGGGQNASRRHHLPRPGTTASHPVATAPRPILPMSGHTRRDRPGCRSIGRSVVAGSGWILGPGFTPGPRVTAARPQFRSMPRPVSSDRGPGKSCSSAAGRLRSDAVRTSPSAICLAEHRVEFRVEPELPDLLRTAAGDGELGSPLQRLLA
jgi:hypothetical protein